MATNDVNLQVINSMTQEQMQSLKDSSGKIPSLANQLIMTDEEDSNLSCLRTETIYDMNSSETKKNWGYTGGIQGGITVSGKDFSKYDSVIVYSTLYGTRLKVYVDMNISQTAGGITGQMGSTASWSNDKTNIFVTRTFITNNKADIMTEFAYFLPSTSNTSRNESSSYYVYKIEGVLKIPAMIYTGAELFGSDTASIKDGVISSNIPCFYTSFDFTSNQSVTGTSSTTAKKTIKSFTVNLPKGKYVSLINCVIKTSQYTVDLCPQIDGTYTGAAATNLTSFVGCSGIGTFNLTDGDHTIDIVLSSRGTATLQSYTKTTFLLIRVGD